MALVNTRRPNTNRDGNAWTSQQILAVWQKATVIPNYDAAAMRRDQCGDIILFSQHGDRNKDFGWEIDHMDPVSNGGEDYLWNLQPLHWKNNVSKSDKTNWTCSMR